MISALMEQEIKNWDDMELSATTLRGIYAYGFDTPSPIQAKAIIPMLSKTDIIAQAQSGTGKTGCFTIGALELIDPTKQETQVIILSPTRELAQQTSSVITALGKFSNVRITMAIGGTSCKDCQTELEKKPHIVIGCPGRVYDMLRRRSLRVNNLMTLIIDEADEMLSSGFKDQVYDIFQHLSQDIQVCLFSATLPPEVLTLADNFMRNPINILVQRTMLTLEGIKQYRVKISSDEDKYECIKDIFDVISIAQAIIYCNSIRRANELYLAMCKDGFAVTLLHSDMTKEEREINYADFKTGRYRVLISTNLTARGIDIQQVSTVINFDVPRDVNTYLHRIGRGGRWGRKGVGISLVTERDGALIKQIEEHYATQIVDLPQNWAGLLALNPV